ncbi:unnamed protein product [Peniophora sp. CBMAI 1063]|nr:unnamed protein product [Peniophora sp. CBMAI 1063]
MAQALGNGCMRMTGFQATQTHQDDAYGELLPRLEVHELRELGTIESGAYVLDVLTTATYRPKTDAILGIKRVTRPIRRAVESLFNPEYHIADFANSTLDTSTLHNNCWPFEAAYGTVGIRLAHPIQLVSMTVRFTQSELLRKRVGVPRKFRIWGLLPAFDRHRLPAQCSRRDVDFASHLVPLLDGIGGETTARYPLLFSEWVADTLFSEYVGETLASSGTTIPSTPCSVPVDTFLLEIWGSGPDAPFTCVNRLHLVGF